MDYIFLVTVVQRVHIWFDLVAVGIQFQYIAGNACDVANDREPLEMVRLK